MLIDIVHEFSEYGANVDVYDPWVDKKEARHEYDIETIAALEPNTYDAIILAVSHSEFIEMGVDAIHGLGKANHVLYDIKYILNADQVDGRL